MPHSCLNSSVRILGRVRRLLTGLLTVAPLAAGAGAVGVAGPAPMASAVPVISGYSDPFCHAPPTDAG